MSLFKKIIANATKKNGIDTHCVNVYQDDKAVPFHLDTAGKTINMTPRIASSATIHHDRIVHGISVCTTPRYNLFVLID